ncbi:MAG: gliding motility-associated C-terminal domain-containing protein [Marinifilum sp.]|jgi:gliding motility-associated-like protein|nr:gliding motility-associated C-terminal domain-containing protein [Marinifilum sp.]
MLKTLLHKTLLTALLILMGGLAAVAQHYVVKGTTLNFKVEENASYKYHWSVTNTSNGSVAYLASTTFESGDYQFNDPGTYEVKVYPEDLGTHCFGEALTMLVVVDDAKPTAVFEDLAVPYVCAQNNGGDTNGKLSVTVNYTGPKPWTFKYSVDRDPAVMPTGADEIYTNSFTFDLEIPNTTGKTHKAEILLVEAKTLSGIPVEKDQDNQTLEVDVLALPSTVFGDYEPVVQAGTIQAYTATIEKKEDYTIFVPSGTTVLNESTSKLSDNFHSELKFDVQWNVAPGDYQIKLIERSAFGCAGDTVYADVKVVESFSVSLGNDISFCSGESRVLTPVIDFDGDYTYLWSNGSVNPTLEVNETGTYSVTVTDTNTGKQSSAVVNVTVWNTPTVDLGPDYQLADSEVLTLDAGNAGANFLWSTGETTQTIQVNTSNTYNVTVTNANGCSASDEIVVTSVNDVFAIELGEDQEICFGDEIVLNPNPSITQDYTYLWSNGAITSTLTVRESGKYTVTVRDKSGNEKSDEVTVTVHALPIVDLGDDITLFDDESVTLDAGDEGIGGSYEWLPNGETTQTITVTEENVYSVRVTSVHGCVGTDEISVTKREGKFAVEFAEITDPPCLGETIYLEPAIVTNDKDFTATKYEWIPSGSNEEGIYVDKGGKYCVSVTDSQGNTEQGCIDVTFDPTPEVNLGDDIILASGEVVNLDAGDAGISYMWYVDSDIKIKPSAIDRIINVSTAGEYRVEVTNEYGCTGRDTILVSTNGSQYNVSLPTAFSPNGDNKNDKLELVGDIDEVENMSLIVVNRLGHKVYQSVHLHRSKGDGWDGTFKGQRVDMDVYVYFLKVTFKDGSRMQKQGNITLLR